MKKIGNNDSFAKFYIKDQIYIDKTETIYNLLDNEERIFISRPRRFGKSLTLDTIATLFEKGVEPYFKGTWIYDKWKDITYPALRLNLLSYPKNDVGEFKRLLVKDIPSFAKKHNVENYVEDISPSASIKSLLDALSDVERSIIVFEYKFAQNENQSKAKLTEAVEQIKTRDYGDIAPRKDDLLRIAAVFNADPKVRAFSQYQLVI